MNAERSFGNWLRLRRRALDLTQEELAQMVGCSAITLRKLESEQRRPSNRSPSVWPISCKSRRATAPLSWASRVVTPSPRPHQLHWTTQSRSHLRPPR